MDAELNLARDLDRHAREHIERVGDAAIGRIFERDHAVRDLAAIDFLEDRGNRSDRDEIDALAKAMNGREMTIRILWTKERDLDRTFERARGTDQLAVNRTQPDGSQRAATQLGNACQHFFFASRVVRDDARRVFDFADLVGQFRPLVH